MNKHTSGPWKHATDFHLYEPDKYNCIIAGDGFINNPGENSVMQDVAKGFHLTGIMTDADARLIAAAPEMYEFILKVKDGTHSWTELVNILNRINNVT